MTEPGQIENVSDTALWVAEYRAMETLRPDAIFSDPFAARLSGQRGRAIVAKMPRGKAMAWPMSVRTKVFDEVVLEFTRSHGVDLVINLAAGLDARPWRLDLPADLHWVDVDLPGILNHKSRELAGETPGCHYEAVTMDLRDEAKRRALFAQLGARHSRVLVLAEGLFVYLPPEAVAALVADLHAQPAFRWMMIDLGSPRLLKMMHRMWGKRVRQGNAPFLFAPPEGTTFFEKHGWREKRYYSSMDEARRLNRQMAFMGFWRFVMNFYPKRIRAEMKRFSGMVVLERN